MIQSILLYLGSIIIILWGIAHIVPTGKVVDGFGDISPDNRRIITMEWIAEGLTLIFIGIVALTMVLQFGSNHEAATLTARICAGMLVALAVLSQLTGARTSVVPMKLCPYIKTAAAILFLLGSSQ